MRAAGHRYSARGPKRIGDEVKLRALWWEGPEPTPGDLLRTSTDRTYLIDQVGAKSSRGTFWLRCIVVPSDAPVAFGHAVFRWTWTRKSMRRPRAWRVA